MGTVPCINIRLPVFVVDIVTSQWVPVSAVVLQVLVLDVVVPRTVVDEVVVLQAMIVDVAVRHCCGTGRRRSHRSRGIP